MGETFRVWGEFWENGGSFRELERLPEMRELQGGKKPAFSMCGTFFMTGELGGGEKGYASPGAGERSATLGRNRKGLRWGEALNEHPSKTKLGGVKPPAGKSPTPAASPVTTGQSLTHSGFSD